MLELAPDAAVVENVLAGSLAAAGGNYTRIDTGGLDKNTEDEAVSVYRRFAQVCSVFMLNYKIVVHFSAIAGWIRATD